MKTKFAAGVLGAALVAASSLVAAPSAQAATVALTTSVSVTPSSVTPRTTPASGAAVARSPVRFPSRC